MDFLRSIISELVEHKDDILIDRKVDEMGVVFTVSVNSEDMGRIVGRLGSTAEAIRTLMRVWGMMKRQRVYIKIVDPPGTRFEKSVD